MRKDVFRKGIVLGIIFLFVGVGVVPSISGDTSNFGDMIYVDDDNTEGPWDGSQEHPYQYIQDGINAANEGDTVFVFNGTYFNKIWIDKQINLIGENKTITVIDTNHTDNFIWVIADYAMISNFTIFNTTSISNPWIDFDAVYWTGDNGTIKNNIFIKNDIAFHLFSGKNNIFLNNEFYSNSCGIRISGIRNLIQNNYFYGNGKGINISHVNNITVINNTFIMNGLCISAKGYHNKILGNNISEGQGSTGIYLKDSYYSTCKENKITTYGRGIVTGHWGSRQSEYNDISDNIISSCYTGIHLNTLSDYNVVSNNTIRDSHTGIQIGNGIDSQPNYYNIIQENKIYNFSINGITIYSRYNLITRNKISGMGDNALYANCYNLDIYHNIFENSSNGLHLNGCKYVNISWNQIININDTGVSLYNSENCNIFLNNIQSKNCIYLEESHLNSIYYNNFIKLYEIQGMPFFYNSLNCKWVQNYWNRARFYPKIILGSITIGGEEFPIPCFNLDVRPAKYKYEIPPICN